MDGEKPQGFSFWFLPTRPLSNVMWVSQCHKPSKFLMVIRGWFIIAIPTIFVVVQKSNAIGIGWNLESLHWTKAMSPMSFQADYVVAYLYIYIYVCLYNLISGITMLSPPPDIPAPRRTLSSRKHMTSREGTHVIIYGKYRIFRLVWKWDIEHDILPKLAIWTPNKMMINLHQPWHVQVFPTVFPQKKVPTCSDHAMAWPNLFVPMSQQRWAILESCRRNKSMSKQFSIGKGWGLLSSVHVSLNKFYLIGAFV